jgi:hypothetical protein
VNQDGSDPPDAGSDLRGPNCDSDPQGPNPLSTLGPIRPGGGSSVDGQARASLENGAGGLSLGIGVAVVPIVIDVLVRSFAAGRLYVDPSSLAYATLTITFAAMVRILSKGDGLAWLGLLFVMSFCQAAIGLMFGGAYLRPHVTRQDLSQAFPENVATGTPLTRPQLDMIHRINDSTVPFSGHVEVAALVLLAGTGILSLLLLVFYWLPRERVAPPATVGHSAREGGH